MQFNYQDDYITQSPLDFNYQFGINNNSPDKFNYTDILVKMPNEMSSASINSIPNILVSANSLISDSVSGYEIEALPINSISFNNPIKLGTMNKINISSNLEQYITQIINTTIGATSSMVNTFSSTGSQDSDVPTTYVWDRDKMDFNKTSTTRSDITAGDIVGIVTAGVQLIISLSFSIANGISANKNFEKQKESINKQIELLNENITANREFIAQAKEAIASRQQRFEKNRKLLN